MNNIKWELFNEDQRKRIEYGLKKGLMSRIHTHTHTVEFIYKLESGRLEISTRLEYFSDEYLSMLFDEYDVVAKFIAERDALAEHAREKYGLVALPPPNFGHMRNTQDQTAQILAMTIDCVPNLTTPITATETQVNQISVTIGNIPVNFAVQQPIMVDGHVLAPVHELFDVLGFQVTWQPETQQIRLLGATGIIVISPNNNIFTIGGVSCMLDVPIQNIYGSTMVPIHAILESLGYDVQWDVDTQTIIIN